MVCAAKFFSATAGAMARYDRVRVRGTDSLSDRLQSALQRACPNAWACQDTLAPGGSLSWRRFVCRPRRRSAVLPTALPAATVVCSGTFTHAAAHSVFHPTPGRPGVCGHRSSHRGSAGRLRGSTYRIASQPPALARWPTCRHRTDHVQHAVMATHAMARPRLPWMPPACQALRTRHRIAASPSRKPPWN